MMVRIFLVLFAFLFGAVVGSANTQQKSIVKGLVVNSWKRGDSLVVNSIRPLFYADPPNS
jgi:hypothetical protein